MMVPGSNVLNMALSVLGRQCFDYYAYAGRETNAIGQDVTTYAEPVNMTGSAQPVPRNLYEDYGLTFNKYYVTFFVEQQVMDPDRDVSGDQFFFNGCTYQCISITDWYSQDGWVSVLAVRIPTKC